MGRYCLSTSDNTRGITYTTVLTEVVVLTDRIEFGADVDTTSARGADECTHPRSRAASQRKARAVNRTGGDGGVSSNGDDPMAAAAMVMMPAHAAEHARQHV